MAETRQQLADLIDAFNRTWVRPERWNEDQMDERSVRIRDVWGLDRDEWTVRLLDLIRTWLLYPEDGPDADLEASPDGLPSYAQSIAKFKDNMMMSAEHAEMALLTALDGNGDGQGT